MPKLSGPDTCAVIRQSSQIPVVIFTSSNDADEVRDAIKKGASDFVLKSTGMIELTERIAFHLNKLKFATTKTTPSEIKTASEAPRKRLATTTLIIDPDEKSRSIIKSVLTRLNQSVVEASNATEAITAFKHHSPDIIISEWSLPDNDGFSMLSELKRVRRGKELLTVMMSARLSPEAQRKAHFLGITNFLVKPLNPAKVEMMIADSVRQTIRNKKRNAGKAA